MKKLFCNVGAIFQLKNGYIVSENKKRDGLPLYREHAFCVTSGNDTLLMYYNEVIALHLWYDNILLINEDFYKFKFRTTLTINKFIKHGFAQREKSKLKKLVISSEIFNNCIHTLNLMHMQNENTKYKSDEARQLLEAIKKHSDTKEVE